MSEQAIQALQDLLDAKEQEIAFLSYLPAPVLETLEQAVRDTLAGESESLTQAIDRATSALPVPLRQIAGGILG